MKGCVLMFLANILSGVANLFAKSVSSACYFFFFDEPKVDLDIM